MNTIQLLTTHPTHGKRATKLLHQLENHKVNTDSLPDKSVAQFYFRFVMGLDDLPEDDKWCLIEQLLNWLSHQVFEANKCSEAFLYTDFDRRIEFYGDYVNKLNKYVRRLNELKFSPGTKHTGKRKWIEHYEESERKKAKIAIRSESHLVTIAHNNITELPKHVITNVFSFIGRDETEGEDDIMLSELRLVCKLFFSVYHESLHFWEMPKEFSVFFKKYPTIYASRELNWHKRLLIYKSHSQRETKESKQDVMERIVHLKSRSVLQSSFTSDEMIDYIKYFFVVIPHELFNPRAKIVLANSMDTNLIDYLIELKKDGLTLVDLPNVYLGFDRYATKENTATLRCLLEHMTPSLRSITIEAVYSTMDLTDFFGGIVFPQVKDVRSWSTFDDDFAEATFPAFDQRDFRHAWY
jgi:hypothetical protein